MACALLIGLSGALCGCLIAQPPVPEAEVEQQISLDPELIIPQLAGPHILERRFGVTLNFKVSLAVKGADPNTVNYYWYVNYNFEIRAPDSFDEEFVLDGCTELGGIGEFPADATLVVEVLATEGTLALKSPSDTNEGEDPRFTVSGEPIAREKWFVIATGEDNTLCDQQLRGGGG